MLRTKSSLRGVTHHFLSSECQCAIAIMCLNNQSTCKCREVIAEHGETSVFLGSDSEQ
jgi:hypothetical protein